MSFVALCWVVGDDLQQIAEPAPEHDANPLQRRQVHSGRAVARQRCNRASVHLGQSRQFRRSKVVASHEVGEVGADQDLLVDAGVMRRIASTLDLKLRAFNLFGSGHVDLFRPPHVLTVASKRRYRKILMVLVSRCHVSIFLSVVDSAPPRKQLTLGSSSLDKPLSSAPPAPAPGAAVAAPLSWRHEPYASHQTASEISSSPCRTTPYSPRLGTAPARSNIWQLPKRICCDLCGARTLLVMPPVPETHGRLELVARLVERRCGPRSSEQLMRRPASMLP